MQNAVLSPAKRKVKCSKTQNKVLHFADCREAFCPKFDKRVTCFWTEKWCKKWVFTTKKRFLGRRKTANQTPKRYKKVQKGGFVLKSDAKLNVNDGYLDKILHFLALICARIFVFESTFCKTMIPNLTVSINICACK